MKQMIQIRCKNNKKTLKVATGSTLSDIFSQLDVQMPYPPVSAKVNNKVEGLHYRVYNPKDIEYLDVTSSSGIRAYTRTLFFVLCKAVHKLFPESNVVIDIPVSNGYYCDLRLGRPVTTADVDKIRREMQSLVDRRLKIRRHQVPTDEAIRLFEGLGYKSKAMLLRTTGKLYTTYYDIEGFVDYFYGTMLINTAQLTLFGVEKYYDGLLLRIPSREDPTQLGALVRQDKMFDIFQEHHRWQNLLGMSTVGTFNEAVNQGHAIDIINLSEALQEKKIAKIAEQIAERKQVKFVLIAGPSSSGKTTFCNRLSIQLSAHGLTPHPISLDNYYVNRVDTPRDENGDYDFECLEALDIELLNRDMTALLNGERVELPYFNFKTGKREYKGNFIQMKETDVLVLEGIHGLNEKLTWSLPSESKFRIYISPLTQINLDSHNRIPTTDTRVIRRIVRDNRNRAHTAAMTLHLWPKVREGENKNIFPLSNEADVFFNTVHVYEMTVLKKYAVPLLKEVRQEEEEYAEAQRLLRLFRYVDSLDDESIIAGDSILREFIGGSIYTD